MGRQEREKQHDKPLRKAVFFDRDGTLIEQIELLHVPEEVVMFPDVAQTIRQLNKLGYLIVIVTNQPVVARGIIGPRDVEFINQGLVERLANDGAVIDAVYFCPHHPNATLLKYRLDCECRKPKPGMLLTAAEEYDIDLSQSYFVGDSTQDVAAGIAAGVRTILVETGHAGNDPWQHKGEPSFIVSTLADIIPIIKKSRT